MRGSIILTAQLDERSDALLEALRTRHFPAALNRVRAHLALFYNLPGTEEMTILRSVAREAQTTPAFGVLIEGPMRLGRGVALKAASARLITLRARLAARFKTWLSGQDREEFRPHVTVQNKVAPYEAAGLFDHLVKTFEPFESVAEGVQLWRYANGPWTPIAAVPFQGDKPVFRP